MSTRHTRARSSHSRSQSFNRGDASSACGTPSMDGRLARGAKLSIADLDAWADDLNHDDTARLARTAIGHGSLASLVSLRDRQVADKDVFNIEVDLQGKAVTDQKQSGRCWIFSTLNILRVVASRKYSIEDFQLSQSYLFFMDHMSKSNWFLEAVLEYADLSLESREMTHLFRNSEVQDGGDYDLAVALIQEFGLVPQVCYPETWSTDHSQQMDDIINSKLRDYALDLRDEYSIGLERNLGRRAAIDNARKLKTSQLKEIYRIMAICCGSPPSPHKPFEWEFRDKKKNFRKVVMTPLEFAESLDYNLADTMLLANDPRNPFNRAYQVEQGGSVVGGRMIRWVNVELSVMKKAVVTQLRRNFPVWFGTDVLKALTASKSGIMDAELFDLENSFNVRIKMNKAERMKTTDSTSNHAMVFVGAHVDEKGRLVRLKVENSWSDKVGEHGFFTMTESFFDNFVYSVAVPKDIVDLELVNVYESTNATVLPAWDAMS